jgi:hypothetical protein
LYTKASINQCSDQCSGSATFRYGSGSADTNHWITDPDPALFSSCFQMPTKFVCSFITVGTFTSVFKDNKLLRRHKTVEIKVFLNFFKVFIHYFACWSESVQQLQIQTRIHEAQKHTDPDPLVTAVIRNTKDLFPFMRRKAALVKMCYLTFFTNCKIKFKYLGISKIHRASFSPQPVCALFILYGLRFRIRSVFGLL